MHEGATRTIFRFLRQESETPVKKTSLFINEETNVRCTGSRASPMPVNCAKRNIYLVARSLFLHFVFTNRQLYNLLNEFWCCPMAMDSSSFIFLSLQFSQVSLH